MIGRRRELSTDFSTSGSLGHVSSAMGRYRGCEKKYNRTMNLDQENNHNHDAQVLDEFARAGSRVHLMVLSTQLGLIALIVPPVRLVL